MNISSGYTISELAAATSGQAIGEASTKVSGIAFSTENVSSGDIFVAVPGLKVDGADFIEKAKTKGAVAAVVLDKKRLNGLPGVLVENPRAALSKLAAIFNKQPSKELSVIGVTGTNGKSTVHWLCSQILGKLNHPCLRIGTLGITLDGAFSEESLTSPDPIKIHSSLRTAASRGATSASMEVSSHGLDQHRLDDVHFDIGVFTNLTRDHLDYHQTMERYFAAKLRLFEILSRSEKINKTAIVYADSEYGKQLLKTCRDLNLRTWGYGQCAEADWRISNFTQSLLGSSFQLDFGGRTYHIKTLAIGQYNAENFSAAFAALVALGFSAEKILEIIPSVCLVPGRLEPVGNQDFGIYVDYAHTPDALENALRALKSLAKNKLWVVFGCGGDRDKGKRPMMAKVACEMADKVIVTSDNPRTEDPAAIINDILGQGAKADFVEVDRRKAIKLAISKMKVGDVLLIAGKGHEDYQIIGTSKIHFSDQEEARAALLF